MSLLVFPLQIKARRGQKVKKKKKKRLVCSVGVKYNLTAARLRDRMLPQHLFFVCPPSLSLHALAQFSSGVRRAPLPASLRHQAERLQGVPRSEHREGEVAGFLKDEKGKSGSCPRVVSPVEGNTVMKMYRNSELMKKERMEVTVHALII